MLGIYKISATGGITATNKDIKKQSAYGGHNIESVYSADASFYVERAGLNKGKNIRSIKYNFQEDKFCHTILIPNFLNYRGGRIWAYLSPPRNGWSPPAKYHSNSGTPVLTLSSVTGFVFKKHSTKNTSAPTQKNARYWLNKGDLLITRSNTPELVGHVAICSELDAPTIYPDLIMKINPNNTIVTTQFLYYQLRSQKLRNYIMNTAHGANPTMKKINKQDVQNFPICYPHLSEQKQIVNKLEQLQEKTKALETIYQQKLTNLEELKKSILQKAFNGDLETIKEVVA